MTTYLGKSCSFCLPRVPFVNCRQFMYLVISLFGFEGRICVTKWIKSCLLQCFGTFKMPILMFISILVFRPEGQIWNPVRRDTRIYVRRILNASRISKTQLNSCTKVRAKKKTYDSVQLICIS